MDLHHHVLPEAAALHLQPAGAKKGHESLEKGLSLIRCRCLGEAGSAALCRIGQKGELAYHQEVAPNIEGRKIEFPLAVGKDAEVHCFLCEILSVTLCVSPGYTQEDQQPETDVPHNLAIDGHRGFADSLEQCFQDDCTPIDISLSPCGIGTIP